MLIWLGGSRRVYRCIRRRGGRRREPFGGIRLAEVSVNLLPYLNGYRADLMRLISAARKLPGKQPQPLLYAKEYFQIPTTIMA